jgi:hypothetical protein
MRIGSLTSAMHTALNGVDRSVERVQRAAETVAAGIRAADRDFTRALAELPLHRRHVRANVAVIRAADELLSELSSLRRR